jgi:uncharacterized oxidoreductase
LITGGASGIGLAMAEAFIKAGNEVLICGRTESKLADAKRKLPALKTLTCNIAEKAEREALFQWAKTEAPSLNVIINNAGIQREIDFVAGAESFNDEDSEIETNLTATIHLSALFVPFLLKQEKECAIINVTSGLAFIPLHIVPVYCATKAAVHAFSISLRSQLANTNIKVFEVAPPIVKTELHREAKARKQSESGIEPEAVASETIKAIKNNQYELVIGRARILKTAARIAPSFFHRLLAKAVAGKK